MNKWKVIVFSTGGGSYYKQYRGLSTWEKPINGPETGDELVEIDTAKAYLFDGENKKWYELKVSAT